MIESTQPLDLPEPPPVLRTENLSKVYPNGTRALDGVSLEVSGADFLVMVGSSGAGKSTFLRCLNRLVTPSHGTLELNGEAITHVSGRKLREVRRQVGMIFQQFHLVRRLTVLENVLVGRLRFCGGPLGYAGSLVRRFSGAEQDLAFALLKQVGIETLAFQRADTLSGGQQQRVAIARTLAQRPRLILADEPIASLDPRSSEVVMGLLRQIHEEQGIPVIVNLHHIDFAKRYGKRIIGLSGGRIAFDGTREELTHGAIAAIYGDDPEGGPFIRHCA